ncbi:F0F1 ATP synthase subunit gamma, partial [bacterium]
MASARDIRRRIKSIKSTQQITKAMKMVAAAKLRKSQERVTASRPFAGKIKEVLARLAVSNSGVSH